MAGWRPGFQAGNPSLSHNTNLHLGKSFVQRLCRHFQTASPPNPNIARRRSQTPEPRRLIGGQNGASNRNGAARTLRAQKQLTRTQRPRLKAARRSFQARARLHRERHPKCKKKTPRPGSRQWTAQILTSARHDLLRTRLGQPAPGQCRLASWFRSRLHPALVLIQVRILCVIPWDGQTVAIGIRPPAVSLLFLAVFPARNPKGKVPRPGEHCRGGGSGRRGHDLDRRRRAVP